MVELDPHVHARLRVVEHPVESPARRLLAQSDQSGGPEHGDRSRPDGERGVVVADDQRGTAAQAGLEMHGGTIREGEPGGQRACAGPRFAACGGAERARVPGCTKGEMCQRRPLGPARR